MSDQDAFDRILAALHDAMLNEALWPSTSALIDEACGLQGNALLFGSGPHDAVRVTSAGFYYRGHRRDDLMREYLESYHPIDESVPRFRQLPDSHLVHSAALYTARELQTSPTYNEMLPRLTAQNGLRVRLAEPDGSHIAWATGDPVTRDSWGSPQLALLRGLLPHLYQFVRVRQALIRTSALHASMTDLLDTPRLGVLYLDRYAQVVAANDCARDLLRRGDGLSDRGGLLQASVPTERAKFAQLVAAALPAASPPVSGSLLLRRAAARPRFVVHVTPVSGPQLDFGARQVAALILIVELGVLPRLDPALVAQGLGLSPAESYIAVEVAAGRTVRDLAATTGRTEHAIYWHLKRIYRKLDLSRQMDLVRVVLSFAAFR